MRCAPESDVDPAVCQERELIGYAGLHLVDLQVGEALLDRAQNLRHGVVASVDDADLKHRGRIACLPRRRHRPLSRGQDLPGLGQERGACRGQRHVMRAPVEQSNTELPLEALDLLAERGLSDVLASRGPAEVELLSERDEESELTELQGHRLRAWGYVQYAWRTGMRWPRSAVRC